MTPELLAWLLELDKQGGEAPPGFDYFRALGEVVHHQAYIELKLKAKLFLDHQIQDASHFAELVFPGPNASSEQKAAKMWLAISFSKFGRMVVVRTPNHKEWDTFPELYEYLEKAGYVVIAPAVLNEEYAGELGQLATAQTWYNRFFHYM